jgi:hypothetical protein
MANLGESFNADDLPTGNTGDYELLPEGLYSAMISKAEVGQTKSGTGTKIDCRFDITGPSHQGRVVFSAINIRNQSAKAEEIGRQQLGEIMRAIGLARLEDSDQLVGGQLQIKVKIKQPSPDDVARGYSQPRNEVAGFRALAGGGLPAPAATKAPAPASATSAKPPWAK